MKNNNTQLYFILGRAELCWNFSSIPKDGSDIHRFSNRKWVSTMWTVGNLWMSETSLSQQEKFQCSSDLDNMKYNSALLFLNQQIGYLCETVWNQVHNTFHLKYILNTCFQLENTQKLYLLSFTSKVAFSQVWNEIIFLQKEMPM